MPQMAPLSWTLLFLIFVVIYMFVTTKTYFAMCTNLDSHATSNNNKKESIKWSW